MLMRKSQAKRLRFEGLENRNLMAGDVTVNVVDGVLQIAGDVADNSIEIKQSGATWKVQGIATTVNGSATIKSFTGINHLEIDLGAGNDALKVTKGTLAGDFEFTDTDGGVATVNLNKLKAKKIDINTHDGADYIRLNGCFAIEDISIKSFATSADVADTLSFVKTKTEMSMYLETGNGDDMVALKSLTGAGQCKVDTFEFGESDEDVVTLAASRFESVRITTGDGSDTISVSKVTATEGGIHLSATHPSGDTGNDVVTVGKSKAHGSLTVATGDGADSVTVTKGAFLDEINIATGSTSADVGDTIVLTNLKGGGSEISCGDGADSLTQTKVVLKYTQIIDMGAGDSDQLLVQKSSAQEATFNGGDNAGDKITLVRNKFLEKAVTGFDIEVV